MTDKLVCPVCGEEPEMFCINGGKSWWLKCDTDTHRINIFADSLGEARQRWLKAFSKKDGEE